MAARHSACFDLMCVRVKDRMIYKMNAGQVTQDRTLSRELDLLI